MIESCLSIYAAHFQAGVPVTILQQSIGKELVFSLWGLVQPHPAQAPGPVPIQCNNQ